MVIRDVYDNYEKHKSKAHKLKKYIIENFEERKICNQFVESVNKCFDYNQPVTQDETVVIL